MIHFDFDDRYLNEAEIGGAISRRESLIWSILVHALVIGLMAVAPALGLFELSPLVEVQPEPLDRPEPEGEFVYIEPLNQVPIEQLREQLELSDIDRRAQTPLPALEPENPLPRSEGNTTERVVSAPEPEPEPELPSEPAVEEAIAEAPEPLEAPDPPEAPRPQAEGQIARNLPPPVPPRPQVDTLPRPGVLREASRNPSRYAQNQTFHNPQGGGADPGASIDFDSKGVDFGPWLRRFVAQVKRNWFIPLAAMNFRGRVVLQFNIHRDGRITDVTVVRPSEIEAFTLAAYNAIIGSNPTEPLPPEYPDEKVLFTVTFFYNETPN